MMPESVRGNDSLERCAGLLLLGQEKKEGGGKGVLPILFY